MRVRVNAIAPGAIRTPINRAAWDTPEAESKLLRLIPYGRVGEPVDVAEAAVWLASDQSDYVTGTTLTILTCNRKHFESLGGPILNPFDTLPPLPGVAPS
jgi:NAD(P)-dependent dehydrogenase (short-subunit alcohol dehydrogenase family)